MKLGIIGASVGMLHMRRLVQSTYPLFRFYILWFFARYQYLPTDGSLLDQLAGKLNLRRVKTMYIPVFTWCILPWTLIFYQHLTKVISPCWLQVHQPECDTYDYKIGKSHCIKPVEYIYIQIRRWRIRCRECVQFRAERLFFIWSMHT